MNCISQTVAVSLADRSYEIVIGSGVLNDPASYGSLPSGRHAAIVTNETVGPLFTLRLQKVLEHKFERIQVIVLPDGESFKTWQTLNLIFDQLLASKCDRNTVLFALGGGVVGDMTGFAAASYMRGIPYVQVPTTLLAQVDSSVGGKTGINHPLGKNMIGAFYQPISVVIDTDTLATLPHREFIAGFAEIIKYGPIADRDFFEWIEENLKRLLDRDPSALTYAIRRSCEIKASVVGQDERESGVRAILNFGHTFGHAIETGLGHGNWLHGEAVGCGMVLAADLSSRLGLLPANDSARIRLAIERAGLPVKAPPLGLERYFELMQVDKKSVAGDIRFVLIDQLGSAVMRTVDKALVSQVISDNC